MKKAGSLGQSDQLERIVAIASWLLLAGHRRVRSDLCQCYDHYTRLRYVTIANVGKKTYTTIHKST